MNQLDLTTPQYAILSVLLEFPGLSNADLARKCFVTPQTMNLIVKNLEKREIIKRNPMGNHGRIIMTELSQIGVHLLEKANKLVKTVEEEFFQNLNDDELIQLTFLLRKVRKK